VALGGEATKDASAEFGMLLFWAVGNHLICMTAMPFAHRCSFLQRTTMRFARSFALARKETCNNKGLRKNLAIAHNSGN
jgi:hypothetical protein